MYVDGNIGHGILRAICVLPETYVFRPQYGACEKWRFLLFFSA